MDLATEKRDRIFRIADALYEESGRRSFPTVDAVRKAARVNMNDASTGMKEWRRSQSALVAPVTVQVPATLQQANTASLNALWAEAVSCANEALRAAQASWELERAESEALREQMANAFEAQSTELESAHAAMEHQRVQLQELTEQLRAAQSASTIAERARAEAVAAMETAKAQSAEIERRAEDLKAELDRAHGAHAKTSAELTRLQLSTAEEIRQLREAQTTAKEANAQRDLQLREDLTQARETAATLRGKLEALEPYVASLAGAQQGRPRGNGKSRAKVQP
ncbi:DNA-binding protein [Massilia sp. TS11]|uniref:DNA-binding protein n=1 Tax=Massilia sp. TS11 TaxID=2908003 RepID=UPI001EDC55FE|nr:DNA-binding protein [Massilia sp. TS11]MCG2583912.1 DNA-binding protein [Massilia sp. TS11]